jgi:hypothetical protein
MSFGIPVRNGLGVGLRSYATLGSKLPNWTPAVLSTALWLDAADASTVTLNNLTASQWNDKSGNARNVLQATAANQPLYVKAQNLLTYSEQIDAANWSKLAVTASVNVITAPDGTLTAEKIEETATTDFHMVRQNYTLANNTQYTLSAYFKLAERKFVQLAPFVGGVGGGSAYFDLETGAVTNIGATNWTVNSTLATFVGDGWCRCSITFTTVTGGAAFIDYRLAPSSGVNNYAGTLGSGAYMWGAQLQTGTLSPYQRTEGAAITATAINNLPALVFDGVNDTLKSTANLGISGTQTFSIFAVHAFPWASLKTALAFGTSGRYHHMTSTASGQYWTGYEGQTQLGTYTPSTPATPFMIGIERTGNTGASWNVFQNGSALTIGAGNNNSVTLTNGPVSVGAFLDGTLASNLTAGEFIIVSGTLSTSDRQKIEGYMAWKWGGF